ncbi:unnamed protein product, partial [Staurois parvus]
MGDTERQLRWALICGIDVPLMGTGMSALMITDHMTEPTSSALSMIGDMLCPRDTAHRRSLR